MCSPCAHTSYGTILAEEYLRSSQSPRIPHAICACDAQAWPPRGLQARRTTWRPRCSKPLGTDGSCRNGLFRHSDSVVTAECRLLPWLAWPARRSSVSCACTALQLCSYGAKADVWALGCVLCVRVCFCVGRHASNQSLRAVLRLSVPCTRTRLGPLGSDRIGRFGAAARQSTILAQPNRTQGSVLAGGHLVVSLRRYELCGLRRPFDGNGIMAIMHSICFVRLSFRLSEQLGRSIGSVCA